MGLRACHGVVATAAIALALMEADQELVLQVVVMNTAAGEYFSLGEETLDVIVPDCYVSCRAGKREDGWGMLQKADGGTYCHNRYAVEDAGQRSGAVETLRAQLTGQMQAAEAAKKTCVLEDSNTPSALPYLAFPASPWLVMC